MGGWALYQTKSTGATIFDNLRLRLVLRTCWTRGGFVETGPSLDFLAGEHPQNRAYALCRKTDLRNGSNKGYKTTVYLDLRYGRSLPVSVCDILSSVVS
jgi:hypothetical protein